MQSDDLDGLTTEQLRQRAYAKAEGARDLHFFWDLAKHLRAARGIEVEDGSAGHITGTIAEVVQIVRELTGHGFGDDEPLVRARFIDYLRD